MVIFNHSKIIDLRKTKTNEWNTSNVINIESIITNSNFNEDIREWSSENTHVKKFYESFINDLNKVDNFYKNKKVKQKTRSSLICKYLDVEKKNNESINFFSYDLVANPGFRI